MDRKLKTCVCPDGTFSFGVHRPDYFVINNRLNTKIQGLGFTAHGEEIDNHRNFPRGDLHIVGAQPIYEIPNAFPFWGSTYILGDVASVAAQKERPVTFSPQAQGSFDQWDEFKGLCLEKVPRPILLAIAQTCTNPDILVDLLPLAAEFVRDGSGNIIGLLYEKKSDGLQGPKILDHDLFETLGNNPALPDYLKQIMLLRPGVQGTSPIVGEFINKDRCHIWEYLRANSYIPWGHFAANMAEDSIRYSVACLDFQDMTGLRHLYYQRIFVTLAHELDIKVKRRGLLTEAELEELRRAIKACIGMTGSGKCRFSAVLWGWNYGYDFSPSGFRLHASHQQIHQQFALVPEDVTGKDGKVIPAYAIGDLVDSFIRHYQEVHGTGFFGAYINAILSNKRTDGDEQLERGLCVYKDENVLLFVPKAQRFHGELHMVCLKKSGNILEADTATRRSIDKAIYVAVKVLDRLGAKMITSFELSKRFGSSVDQRLMYCFIPRHPYSPGAFSEQQARWITGHFPEDFARSCRQELGEIATLLELAD